MKIKIPTGFKTDLIQVFIWPWDKQKMALAASGTRIAIGPLVRKPNPEYRKARRS